MLIATFNVNSVRTRLPILERWLKINAPDFLFMQETKTQDKFFPALAFKEMGYTSYYHGGFGRVTGNFLFSCFKCSSQ